MKKILFLGTTSFAAKNFRLNLFRTLIANDFVVYCTCSDTEYIKEIKDCGVNVILIKFNNRSVNPFSLISLFSKFKKAIKDVRPDIVFTYQLKPNILGPLAAKKCRINKIISLNEGLGDAFATNSNLFSKFKKICAIKLHKKSFSFINQLIVLNETDCDFFASNRIISKEKITIIHGIGIDVNDFKFCEEFPEQNNVLMISRLVKNKGIFDFCKVAQRVKKKNENIKFLLVGPEQELKASDLDCYINNGIITYLGEKHDVKKDIQNSKIVLLLSYQEGFGLSLAEAMSIGRPVIAYENSGTKIIIDNGINGFLFPKQDVVSVSNKIVDLINNNSVLKELGKNGRKKVENNFESSQINNLFLSCILKTFC